MPPLKKDYIYIKGNKTLIVHINMEKLKWAVRTQKVGFHVFLFYYYYFGERSAYRSQLQIQFDVLPFEVILFNPQVSQFVIKLL